MVSLCKWISYQTTYPRGIFFSKLCIIKYAWYRMPDQSTYWAHPSVLNFEVGRSLNDNIYIYIYIYIYTDDSILKTDNSFWHLFFLSIFAYLAVNVYFVLKMKSYSKLLRNKDFYHNYLFLFLLIKLKIISNNKDLLDIGFGHFIS